jgi:DNA-binding ferritin-like protein
LRSIGQVAAEPRFDDGDADFLSPREMLPNLVADNVAFADSMRTIYEICREAGDYGTAGMLEVYIDECERRARFLYEASYED